jgi:hypothetical protein
MDNVKKKIREYLSFFLLNYFSGFYKQNNMFSIFSIFTWIIKKIIYFYLFIFKLISLSIYIYMHVCMHV